MWDVDFIDKDVCTQIMNKIMDYVENPTEDKLDYIVDTLIYFNVHIDIGFVRNDYRFTLSRNRFYHAEPLDIDAYRVIEPLVDRYRIRNHSALMQYLERD